MEEEFKLVKGEMDHRSSTQCEVVAKDRLQWVISRIKNGDVESADDFRRAVEKALDSVCNYVWEETMKTIKTNKQECLTD
jgi:hypothetical protein